MTCLFPINQTQLCDQFYLLTFELQYRMATVGTQETLGGVEKNIPTYDKKYIFARKLAFIKNIYFYNFNSNELRYKSSTIEFVIKIKCKTYKVCLFFLKTWVLNYHSFNFKCIGQPFVFFVCANVIFNQLLEPPYIMKVHYSIRSPVL